MAEIESDRVIRSDFDFPESQRPHHLEDVLESRHGGRCPGAGRLYFPHNRQRGWLVPVTAPLVQGDNRHL
jgi:hypothetical protein